MPGFPVHHQLPEHAQTHVHPVGHAIQPSSSVINFCSYLQSFPTSGNVFQWVSSSHQVAKIQEFQLQHPMNVQDWFLLGVTGLNSLLSKGLSRVFSNTILQKHKFLSTQLCVWSNSHIHTWLLEKKKRIALFDYTDLCWQSMSLFF